MPVDKKLSLEQIREVLISLKPCAYKNQDCLIPRKCIDCLMAEFERITDDRTIF